MPYIWEHNATINLLLVAPYQNHGKCYRASRDARQPYHPRHELRRLRRLVRVAAGARILAA